MSKKSDTPVNGQITDAVSEDTSQRAADAELGDTRESEPGEGGRDAGAPAHVQQELPLAAADLAAKYMDPDEAPQERPGELADELAARGVSVDEVPGESSEDDGSLHEAGAAEADDAEAGEIDHPDEPATVDEADEVDHELAGAGPDESQDQPEEPRYRTFADMNLEPAIMQALDDMGYENPMPVQVAVYDRMIAGKDIMVQSKTGSGKTAGFGIPIAQLVDAKSTGAQVLILAPTRELALQVSRELERIAVHKGLSVVPVYGGAAMKPQIDALRAGAQIVAGTPGRVLDHLRRGTLKGEGIRILVLDECDEMLSMGFQEDIEAIIAQLAPREERQTVLFSATIPDEIQRIARRHMNEPETISLSTDGISVDEIEHYYYVVSGMARTRDLLKIIKTESPESAIIFCNTREDTNAVAKFLRREGYDAEAISSDLTQRERERVMERMRANQLHFLVATDVAARGIDISGLSHVINYTFPESPEVYVHRTGRTGRAGKSGVAVSLVGPRELSSFYYLKLIYKIRPKERDLPTSDEMSVILEGERYRDVLSRVDEEPADEYRSLARRVWQSTEGERVVGFLLQKLFSRALGKESPAEREERRGEREARVEREERRGEREERRGEREERRGEREERRGEREGRAEREERRGERESRRAEREPRTFEREERRPERESRRAEREERGPEEREPRTFEREERGPEERMFGGEERRGERETRMSEREARRAEREARREARRAEREERRAGREARTEERDAIRPVGDDMGVQPEREERVVEPRTERPGRRERVEAAPAERPMQRPAARAEVSAPAPEPGDERSGYAPDNPEVKEFWEAWADEVTHKRSQQNHRDRSASEPNHRDRSASEPRPARTALAIEPDDDDDLNESPDTQGGATTRLYVNLGKREDLTATMIRDLLGQGLGKDKDKIGSVALRNTHCYVRVPEDIADRVIHLAMGKTYKDRELVVERARR